MIFTLHDDATEHPVITVEVQTATDRLFIMGLYTRNGRCVILTEAHIHGASANTIGHRQLMKIAQAALREFDLDAIEIAGGVRTSGANPGRTPRIMRFTRRP